MEALTYVDDMLGIGSIRILEKICLSLTHIKSLESFSVHRVAVRSGGFKQDSQDLITMFLLQTDDTRHDTAVK